MNTISRSQYHQGKTIQSLRAGIPAHLQSIFDSFTYAIGLRSNPVGLTTRVNKLFQDLTTAGQHKLGLDEWHKILQELRNSLIEIRLEVFAQRTRIIFF